MCAQLYEFITPTAPWNHRHSQETGQFPGLPPPSSLTLCLCSKGSPTSQPRQLLWSVFLRLSYDWNGREYIIYWDWLLPLSLMPLGFIQVPELVCSVVVVYSFLLLHSIALYGCLTVGYPSTHGRTKVFSTSWQVQRELCKGNRSLHFPRLHTRSGVAGSCGVWFTRNAKQVSGLTLHLLPSYPLGWSVLWKRSAHLVGAVCFQVADLWEFLIYSGYKSFVTYVIGKYSF